jgi:hypothetical protein
LTLVGVLLLIHLVQFAVATAAPNPPPVQIYYIPVPENQAFAAFAGIYPGGAADKCDSVAPNVASPINTYVSISIISAGTIVYYDQWEDDFEIDIAHPVQATTQIWGDANPANGFPPGIPGDVLSPDTVVVLNNAVPVPRQSANLFFDGGDKVGASRPVAMTRATWSGSYPQAPGTLLADALEVYDTSRWGTRYQAPVGVDTATNQLFEYTGMAIMAAEDNTTQGFHARIDRNGPLFPNFGYDGGLARQQRLFDLCEVIPANRQLPQVVEQAPYRPCVSAYGEPYRSAQQTDQAPSEQANGRPDRSHIALLFDRHLAIGISGNNSLCVEIDAAFILQLLESLRALIGFELTIEYNY